MLGRLSWVCLIIFTFSSVHSLTSVAPCPSCGPEVADLIRAELSGLRSKICGPLVGKEYLLGDIKFLQDGVAKMFKDGKLNLRGKIGDTGMMGRAGDTGRVGPAGAPGRSGVRGRTGPTGDAGSTGPMGFTGAKGASGYMRRSKRQASEEFPLCRSVRDQIDPLLVQCPQVSNYFLQYADEIQARCSGPLDSPTKDEKENLEELVALFEQVLLLFKEVQTTYDGMKDLVQADPQYKGVSGFPGKPGFTGATGARGQKGIQGAAGSTGPKGGYGLTGARGHTGDTGPTGGSGHSGRGYSGARK